MSKRLKILDEYLDNQMSDLDDIQSYKIKEAFIQLQGTGPVVPVHNNVTKRNEGCPRVGPNEESGLEG